MFGCFLKGVPSSPQNRLACIKQACKPLLKYSDKTISKLCITCFKLTLIEQLSHFCGHEEAFKAHFKNLLNLWVLSEYLHISYCSFKIKKNIKALTLRGPPSPSKVKVIIF